MSYDVISDLLDALNRVRNLDVAKVKDVLIISGFPEPTENLHYLGYNHQVFAEKDAVMGFSAVAVINNRRASKFRLEGRRKQLSELVFNTRWTRNPMDLFLNRLRCHTAMMDLLTAAAADFTLVGILQVDEVDGDGLLKRRIQRVRPLIAIPGIASDALATVVAFETDNEVRKKKMGARSLSRRIKQHSQDQ